MTSDDRVLALQRWLDRLVRRMRRGSAPPVTHRRFLIVQIDGLSGAVFERALATGYMPFVRRLLGSGRYRRQPMSVGMPTSTPAFQMAAMYGVQPDIPGFHYYSRERRGDIHFPRAGHAAWVEGRHAAGRRGILRGGSAYGCVFAGGAENNLFTFSGLTRRGGRGLAAGLSPFVVLLWVALKSLARTAGALGRIAVQVLRTGWSRRQGWRWLSIKIGIGIWVRGCFTLAASRDLYAGVPAIYVNYLDYDEAAHAFGPGSRTALRALRRVDRSIRQLWRVARRVPEHQYDLYILSDHGQAACRPFAAPPGLPRFEQWVGEQIADGGRPDRGGVTGKPGGLVRGMRSRSRESTGVFQQFINYLNEDYIRRPDPEAWERDGIRVISAGPNAFVYVLDAAQPLSAEALEQRFPGLATRLSRSPDVGFVLARSADGHAVCYRAGQRYRLSEAPPEIFSERPDAALVIAGLEDLMRMPSAGDLVIYGIAAVDGNVSFIPEAGAHAGPSAEEMNTFIVHPAGIELPSPIEHPCQLHEHFLRYQAQADGTDAGAAEPTRCEAPAPQALGITALSR